MPASTFLAKLAVFLPALAGAMALAADVRFQCTDAQGRPVPDAVITLTPLEGAKPPLPSGVRAEIGQREKQFVPQVTVVPVGGTVVFTNQEPRLMHQIYSVSEAKNFEIPLHRPGNASPITFDRAGVVVIGCSIHDTMSGFIVVADTPWFAKTAANGAASIADAPPGRYRATVWHARLEKPEAIELVLPAEKPVAFTLALKPEPRVRRVLEAGGAGYK